MKNCTPFWREVHVEAKMYKTQSARTEVEMPKKSTLLWREASSQVKMRKTHHVGTTRELEVEVSKKCAPLREVRVQVTSAKKRGVRSTFGRSDVASRGRQKGLRTFSEVSKTGKFYSSFNNFGTRMPFQRDLQRCMLPGRRSTRDTWVRDVRKSRR